MLKNKIVAIIASFVFLLSLGVGKAYAIATQIVISDLPSYVNYQNQKISYSALADDPSSIQVQFYSMKEGGSYAPFGAVLNGASGQIYVDAAQIGESGKKYFFKAEIVGAGVSDETSTTFDQTAPAAPGSYSKEKINPNFYKIRWHTPGDSDFSRVFVYRGTEPGFSADGSHKVGEVGGAKDTDVVWEDNGLDGSKEYFYALRAIDWADNSSGLVGDQGVVAGASTQVTGTTKTTTKTIVLPKEEEPAGEVLSGEAQEEPKAGIVEEVNKIAGSVTRSKKNMVLAGLLVLVAIVILKDSLRKKN